MSSGRGLRIGGGERRGLRLQAPAAVRPTSGRLRGALFDIWSGQVPGSAVLDLFAGSGAVGIEAASRGAARVLLVEADGAVFRILERNLVRAALPAATALRARLPGELERRLGADDRFDLIFADPPYGFAETAAVLQAAAAHLATGGQLALEERWRASPPPPPPGLVVASHRRYGDSGLTIFARG